MPSPDARLLIDLTYVRRKFGERWAIHIHRCYTIAAYMCFIHCRKDIQVIYSELLTKGEGHLSHDISYTLVHHPPIHT